LKREDDLSIPDILKHRPEFARAETAEEPPVRVWAAVLNHIHKGLVIERDVIVARESNGWMHFQHMMWIAREHLSTIVAFIPQPQIASEGNTPCRLAEEHRSIATTCIGELRDNTPIWIVLVAGTRNGHLIIVGDDVWIERSDMKFSIFAAALDPMNGACSGPARGCYRTERAVLREMRFDEVLIEGKPSGRALRKRQLNEQQGDEHRCSESIHSGHRNPMG